MNPCTWPGARADVRDPAELALRGPGRSEGLDSAWANGILAACENPRVNIIGHPLARKFGRRPEIEVDLPALFAACAATGTALEVNAHPARLDLPSAHLRAARDAGVKFSIGSDAHSAGHLANLRYGVGTAQRGWLTPDDVINTWPLARLTAFLAKGSGR